MNNMIDRTQIPAAMAYYMLDDVEDLEPHMIEADYADFCNALDYFDESKKLENMPWWAMEILYKLLCSEAFYDYDSGNDVLPYNLDVSNRQEMEWVIDLVQSWGVHESNPNESIDANENHYFVCAADYGMGMSDCWVEIFNA